MLTPKPRPELAPGTNPYPATVDSVFQAPANRDKEWVRRLLNPNAPTTQIPGEEHRSSLLMSDNGRGYVYPSLVQEPMRRGLIYLDQPGQAEAYARKNNAGIQFKTGEQGSYFAANGYKQGHGTMNDIDSETGKSMHWDGYEKGLDKDQQPGKPQAMVPRITRRAKGGLLPNKLTMLGPDGKPQMELGGGNRIFSRANTRELVSRSQNAKTPAELKELGGRIKAMLDRQDRNKPEYVKD